MKRRGGTLLELAMQWRPLRYVEYAAFSPLALSHRNMRRCQSPPPHKTSHGWRSLEGRDVSEAASPGADAVWSGHGGDVGE